MCSYGLERSRADTNIPDTTAYTYSHTPWVVTVVYHPKGDLANIEEERCDLLAGGKISVSLLKDAFNSDPIQLVPDGKFHITGDPIGPPKLSLVEYLSSIPPAASYGNLPSRSATTVDDTRRPNLLPWDNFKEQVRIWASGLHAHNTLYDPPGWHLFHEITREVSELQPFIKDNVLGPAVKPFDAWKFVHPTKPELQPGGEPDFVGKKNGSLVSLVEVKGKWNVPAERNIRAQYQSDTVVASAVNQLYSYLALYHRKAGILTTYDMTWFFDRREENGEEVTYESDGIEFNCVTPTLFQCIAYFMSEVANDVEFKSPPSSRASSARLLRKSSSQEMTQTPLKQSFSADDIDAGEFIGVGRTGAVFLADSNLTALKTLDIAKRPTLLPEILNEISMYTKMKALQGKFIPPLRYCGVVEGILFVVGFDYVGKVPDHLSESQKRKLLEGLAEIHSMGILHGDIRLANIVVDSSGDPYIIDFAMSGGI